MEFDRITIDPTRMNGQPCVRNMRLTVRRVVELAAFILTVTNYGRNIPSLMMRMFGKLSYTQRHILMTVLLSSG
jgi:uncharacterized protein (DUF433 family)